MMGSEYEQEQGQREMHSDLLHKQCFEMEIEQDLMAIEKEQQLVEILKDKEGYAYFTAKEYK